jgi:hypothetical protein
MHEAKIARLGNDDLSYIVELLSTMEETLSNVLSKKGKLKSPLQKKAKEHECPSTDTTKDNIPPRPIMVDSSTDTMLTPRWWRNDSEEEAETVNVADNRAKRKRRRQRPNPAADIRDSNLNPPTSVCTGRLAAQREPPHREPTDMELSESQWTEVTRRGAIQKARPQQVRLPVPARRPVKPPAVLIKIASGSSYADTVKAVRSSSGISPEKIGAKVNTMRQTKDGHLIIELTKGLASQAAASKLSEAITSNLGDRVGQVVRLGTKTEVEILDLDAAVQKEEVLAALRGAVQGEDATALSERDNIQVTGLWATRNGQQMATATMAPSTAAKITKIPVGWMMCRVRPRRQAPIRCHRCHGFGHSSNTCVGPDLAQACRRCGEDGHQEKTCPNGTDRCVACDRAGLPRTAHRPGSAACGARNDSLKARNQATR